MTTAANEIRRYQPPSFAPGGRAPAVSQATAIEQQRAIAEVQAAVVVAQSCPRDLASAESEMEYVCSRTDMAEQAFYAVKNRGTGPTVHLMRELARIWGNVDYGVKELHRDDDKGESEVQAFAWDIQKNTRSSRTFIVPHQRMKEGRRVELTDLQDVYLNNQNIGARAVRECIETILPRWLTEKAKDICNETLRNGEGEPLQERINTMVGWFEQMGVTLAQIEARIGKPRGQWDANDVAQMKIAGKSINRGEVTKDELFPAIAAVSTAADEIASADPEPAAEPEKPKRTRARSKAKAEPPAPDAETAPPAPEPEPAEKPAEPEGEQADPGQGGGNDQSQGAEPSSSATHPSDSGDQAPAAETKPPKTSMRKAVENRLFQMTSNIHKIVGGKPLTREERIALYNHVFDRTDITSTDDLYDPEVAAVADKLFTWGKDGQLVDEINEVRNLAAIAEAAAGGQQELAAE